MRSTSSQWECTKGIGGEDAGVEAQQVGPMARPQLLVEIVGEEFAGDAVGVSGRCLPSCVVVHLSEFGSRHDRQPAPDGPRTPG